MKLDILVIAAHPDDAELGCGGTIVSQIAKGYKVGIADLTRGELGTRGSAEIRKQESDEAAKILGVSDRVNLGFEDGFFENDKYHNLELIKIIRKFQPEIVLANAIKDRHTDHGKGAELSYRACFLSGLIKIETSLSGQFQKAWRPKALYNFIQANYITPDFVFNVTNSWDKKMEAIRAYRSQFFDPNSKEPETFISKPEFMNAIVSRAIELGQSIGVKYGEGFTKNKQTGIEDLFDLI